MQLTNIYQAKANLSQLIQLALAGKDVAIAKAGKPMVRLVPIISDIKPRTPGRLKGKIWVSEDFDEEDPEINKLFYGSDDKT